MQFWINFDTQVKIIAHIVICHECDSPFVGVRVPYLHLIQTHDTAESRDS